LDIPIQVTIPCLESYRVFLGIPAGVRVKVPVPVVVKPGLFVCVLAGESQVVGYGGCGYGGLAKGVVGCFPDHCTLFVYQFLRRTKMVVYVVAGYAAVRLADRVGAPDAVGPPGVDFPGRSCFAVFSCQSFACIEIVGGLTVCCFTDSTVERVVGVAGSLPVDRCLGQAVSGVVAEGGCGVGGVDCDGVAVGVVVVRGCCGAGEPVVGVGCAAVAGFVVAEAFGAGGDELVDRVVGVSATALLGVKSGYVADAVIPVAAACKKVVAGLADTAGKPAVAVVLIVGADSAGIGCFDESVPLVAKVYGFGGGCYLGELVVFVVAVGEACAFWIGEALFVALVVVAVFVGFAEWPKVDGFFGFTAKWVVLQGAAYAGAAVTGEIADGVVGEGVFAVVGVNGFCFTAVFVVAEAGGLPFGVFYGFKQAVGIVAVVKGLAKRTGFSGDPVGFVVGELGGVAVGVADAGQVAPFVVAKLDGVAACVGLSADPVQPVVGVTGGVAVGILLGDDVSDGVTYHAGEVV